MFEHCFARPRMWTLVHMLCATALAALAATGCATKERPLPEAKGQLRALNPGAWEPEPYDLKGPRSPYPLPTYPADR